MAARTSSPRPCPSFRRDCCWRPSARRVNSGAFSEQVRRLSFEREVINLVDDQQRDAASLMRARAGAATCRCAAAVAGPTTAPRIGSHPAGIVGWHSSTEPSGTQWRD